MRKQSKGQKRGRGVLDQGPNEVSVAQIGGQLSRRTRSPDVGHDRVGHIPGSVSGQAKPVAEIDVLAKAEVVLVETPHVEHGLAAVQGGRGAGREDFPGLEIALAKRSPVPFPPGQAAKVPAVADPVEDVVVAGEHLPRPERGTLRISRGGHHERLEPAGLRKGVGVEQGDQWRGGCGDATIGRGGEAEILTGRVEQRAGYKGWRGGDGLVGGDQRPVVAGVVHHHDPLRKRRLPGQTLQAPPEVIAAVEVDDHDGDSGCFAGRGRLTHDARPRLLDAASRPT